MVVKEKESKASEFASEFLLMINQRIILLNPEMIRSGTAISRFNGLVAKAYLIRED